MSPEQPIHDFDLNAFMDGELDDDARREIELYLAQDPEAAARLMADMATMHALRVAMEPRSGPPSKTLALAERLEAGLARPRQLRAVLQTAVLVIVFLGGWASGQTNIGWPGWRATPEFVDEAMMSHRTALLRARMDSQPEVTAYDPQEIRAATRIALPPIPGDWRITDVQVFPSDEGPSVGLAFQTPDGPVSLFGFRTNDGARISPTLAERGRGRVAYWQAGDMGYALIGPSEPRELSRLAARLARSAAATLAS